MSEIKQSLIRNTVFNVFGYFWTLALGFIITPFLIHFVGLRDYGLYVLYGAALSWLWILDLGISMAATRSLSRYSAEGDEKRFSECFSTTMAVKVVTGTAVGACILLAAVPISRWLDASKADAGLVLQIMGLNYVISNCSQAYNAGLAARQRMDIPSRIGVALSLPGTVAALTILILGRGLPGFLSVNLAISATYLLLVRRSLRRLIPSYDGPCRIFCASEMGELLSFSTKQTVSRLAYTFLASADRIALGGNLHGVSFYQLGATVGWRVWEFTATAISAALPAATDFHARGDWMGMNQVFRRGTKYMLLLGLPLMLFAAIFAEEVLMLWIGVALQPSAAVLRILAAGYSFLILANMANIIAAAANRPDLQARSSIMAAGAALATYYAWGRHQGLIGLAASISAGFAVLGTAQMAQVLVSMKGRVSLPPGEVIGRPLAAILLAAAIVGVPAKWLCMTQQWIASRAGAIVFVASVSIAAILAYLIFLKLLRVLDDRDREAIKSIFRKEGHLFRPRQDSFPEPAA